MQPAAVLASDLMPALSKWANSLAGIFLGSSFMGLSQLPSCVQQEAAQ